MTIICRKANENENFATLVRYVKIVKNHPKIFFTKIQHSFDILGDQDRLETDENNEEVI